MLKWDKRLEKTGSLSKDVRFHELRKVLTTARKYTHILLRKSVV